MFWFQNLNILREIMTTVKNPIYKRRKSWENEANFM